MVGGGGAGKHFSKNVLPGAAWTVNWTQRRSLGDWVTEGGKVEYPKLILYESEYLGKTTVNFYLPKPNTI